MFECIKRWLFPEFYDRPRILTEDLLIEILDFLPIQQLIEMMKVSPQLRYCVKELIKRKRLLVLFENLDALKIAFYISRRFRYFNQANNSLNKNIVIPFGQLNGRQTTECMKFVSKRCPHLNVLAINQQIEDKQIKDLNTIFRTIDKLFLGYSVLYSNDEKKDELIVNKIGSIFGARITSLNLRFSYEDMDPTPKLIALLSKCPKLEELRVAVAESIDCIFQYIPKTIQILSIINVNLENEAQSRQYFKDLIQRMENKFTAFGLYYPLNEQLFDLLKTKLKLNALRIEVLEIPIKSIWDTLSLQQSLNNLCIKWQNTSGLNIDQQLDREYLFWKVVRLGFVNIKVNKLNMQRIIKCFPNVSRLFLSEIEFICDCDQWSTLCLQCSYQCFQVFAKFESLKKLKIESTNFRIRCKSLEMFVKLCRIFVFDQCLDYNDLVENVKQLCNKRTQQMFYLHFISTSQQINELSQNIPKNLSIKMIF